MVTDAASILRAPPSGKRGADGNASITRRKTGGGDGRGSVFGDAVQGGLEALFGKLSELLGDRIGLWWVRKTKVLRQKLN